MSGLFEAQQAKMEVERQRNEMHQTLSEKLQAKMEELSVQRKVDLQLQSRLESQVQDLQSQLFESNRELRSQIEINDELHNTIAAIELEKTDAQSSLLEMETELAQLKTDVARLSFEKNELEEKYKHANEAVIESQQLVNELSQNFREMEDVTDAARRELAAMIQWRREHEQRERERNQNTHSSDDLENTQLRKQIENLENQIHDLKKSSSNASGNSTKQGTPTHKTYGWGSVTTSPALGSVSSPSSEHPESVPRNVQRLNAAVDSLSNLCDAIAKIRTSATAQIDNVAVDDVVL